MLCEFMFRYLPLNALVSRGKPRASLFLVFRCHFIDLKGLSFFFFFVTSSALGAAV